MTLTDDAPHASVAELVKTRMGDLPAAERKVGRALLAGYPAAGLGTAQRLAELAGASAPTVVRFVARLGFDGYRGFQDALRDEVQGARTASPLTLPQRASGDDLGTVSARVLSSAVGESLTAVPDSEVRRALDLLADVRSHITCVGGRYSHVLATYFDLHLRQLRPGTSATTYAEILRAAPLLDLGRRNTLVLFDVRRYQRDAVELSTRAHEQGARIVLITDPWLSPVAEVADVVLSVQVEGPSPFDSQVPATALVEMLVAGLLERLGPIAAERMRRVDELARGTTIE